MWSLRISVSGFLFLLFIAAVFSIDRGMPDAMIMPKWFVTIMLGTSGVWLLALLSLCSKATKTKREILFHVEILILLVCTVQAGYGLLCGLPYMDGIRSGVIGSFDNPAGYASCLAFSLPMGLRHWKDYGRWSRYLVVSSKLICACAIVVSGSRVGVLCVVLCTMMVLSQKFKLKSFVLSLLMIVIMLGLTLCVKTDSTRGRWFIAQRTMEMIAERPLTGWGQGGFDANYMNVQADYFSKHPDSEYSMLADNIRHPLNEFLLLTVDYGLLALLIVLCAVVFVIWWYQQHPSEIGQTGLRLLACIIMFSMFSYPFLYPFTWLMLLFAIVCIFNDVSLQHNVKRIIRVSAIFILPIIGYMVINKYMLYKEWGKVQHKAYCGQSKKMMPQYAELYPELKNDCRFLYNYASEQYVAGNYDEALQTAEECGKSLADYNLNLLIADIHRVLKNYERAICHYERASLMCPSRFIPLYEQYCVHRQMGNGDECSKLADVILHKPIKIQSLETNNIIEDIKRMEQIRIDILIWEKRL